VRGVLAAVGWRLLAAVPVLVLASVLVFVALRAGPEAEGGVLPVRYVLWLGGVLAGEWGVSAQSGVAVARLLGAAVPATLELAALGVAVGGVLGLAGGLALFVLRSEGGRKEGREALAESGTAMLMAVPALLWALGLLVVFALGLGVAPVAGRVAPGVAWPGGSGFLLLDALLAGNLAAFGSALRHMALPALALGLGFAPPVMRVLGAALSDAARAPFALQARWRGESAFGVLLGEALPLAAVPALAAMGRQFGLLLGAAVVVEAVCLYPGLGRLLVEAARAGDLAVVEAAGLAFAVVAVLGQAVVAGVCRGLAPEDRP
jgi:ABC-type dipeptide/oligopeptide/nickel transport system permease component